MTKNKNYENNNQVANFNNLAVRFDHKTKELYVVYSEDYPGTRMGIDVVLRDGYVMPFRYVQTGGMVSRDYVQEIYKDYGRRYSFEDTLKLLGINNYDESYEFTVSELRMIEVILNERVKEAFSDVLEVKQNGNGELAFLKKGDIYLARASYNDSRNFKGYSYLMSIDGKNVIAVDLEKEKALHFTNEAGGKVLSQKLKGFEPILYSELNFSEMEDLPYITLEVAKQKLKERNQGQPENE